jgi:cell division protein FtsN
METKIFMSLSQLTRDLLGAFLAGIVFGAAIGGLLFLKFKKHFKKEHFPKTRRKL